jgi:Large polyvalent protein-associated domain 7
MTGAVAGRSFYVDATVQQPAFRDRGDHLAAERADPNAIRDMTEIAKHRGRRGRRSFVERHG